jgi:hypothetical protein
MIFKNRVGQVWQDSDGEIFLVLETKNATHTIVWLYCLPEYDDFILAGEVMEREEFKLWEEFVDLGNSRIL